MPNLKYHFRPVPIFVCPLVYFSGVNRRIGFTSCIGCQYINTFCNGCVFLVHSDDVYRPLRED